MKGRVKTVFIDGKKRCYVCKTIKELSDFRADASRYGGKDNRCRKCQDTLREIYRKKVGWYNRPSVKAKETLNQAVRVGRIIKQPCEVCGATKVQAHHHKGYAKKNWLNVQWLCSKHHQLIHKKMTKEQIPSPSSESWVEKKYPFWLREFDEKFKPSEFDFSENSEQIKAYIVTLLQNHTNFIKNTIIPAEVERGRREIAEDVRNIQAKLAGYNCGEHRKILELCEELVGKLLNNK
jgi:hypothetical protein